jgi:hypothetical protein
VSRGPFINHTVSLGPFIHHTVSREPFINHTVSLGPFIHHTVSHFIHNRVLLGPFIHHSVTWAVFTSHCVTWALVTSRSVTTQLFNYIFYTIVKKFFIRPECTARYCTSTETQTNILKHSDYSLFVLGVGLDDATGNSTLESFSEFHTNVK